MSLRALEEKRFVRKTQLAPGEYRKNFHQIDREVLAAITSLEADRVTPLMSKIYLRLVNAPDRYWEREGVLRIEAEVRRERLSRAWVVLCELVGVSSATASKALRWMHEQGIIGYFAGKNGVGLRIFLNRAASSIGVREARGAKKILVFPPASAGEGAASKDEAAFSDSYADRESSETDRSPAPKKGAGARPVGRSTPVGIVDTVAAQPTEVNRGGVPAPEATVVSVEAVVRVEEVVKRLRAELEPALEAAAREAARCEQERTREWLESRGLPKAARVAQHEAYNILRKHGLISVSARGAHAQALVGQGSYERSEPQKLSESDVAELAQACLAMLETKGQAIELTLSEMDTTNGGFLLPVDVCKVRERAKALLNANDSQGV